MYSDDDQDFLVGGPYANRRQSPPRETSGTGRGRSRSPIRNNDLGTGGCSGAGRGGKEGRGRGGRSGPRTTGREIPQLNSIHHGSIHSIQAYGAFVQLGDGTKYKDGLLHISRLSVSGRVEKVDDLISVGDKVYVKVCEVREEESKYSLDMRFVSQKDGTDNDPNNVQVDAKGSGKGKGGSFEPIRIGAVQGTTCTRCGARGHMARECFGKQGVQYELIQEPPAVEQSKSQIEETSHASKQDSALGHKASKIHKKKLKAGNVSDLSSSVSSSTEAKKTKKGKSKKKKKDKKEKKRDQKKAKKQAKILKKELKRAKDQSKSGKSTQKTKDRSASSSSSS